MASLICFYRFPHFTMSLRPVNTLTRANLYSHVILAMIGLAALAATYHGWRLFWFFTDDAFIAFRYVSNAIAGYGYTWNPPPFRPI